MQLFLLRSTEQPDKEFLLKPGENLIGRDPACQINEQNLQPLNTSQLSRKHVAIQLSESGIQIRDLESTNGTFVNKSRISGEARLKHGDVIIVGKMEFCVLRDSDADATILMGKLTRNDWKNAESSIEAHGLSGTQTVIKRAYPLPAGWEKNQDDSFFSNEKFTGEKVNQLIEQERLSIPEASAVLVVLSGLSESRLFFLAPQTIKQAWTLGRDAKNLIELNDASISGKHATLLNQNGIWAICDHESTNGMYVNLKRETKTMLHDNDRIRLGSIDLLFRLLTPANASA